MTTAIKAPTAHPHDAALSKRERAAEADIAAAFQLVAAAIVRGVTADNAQEIAARLQRDATWQPLRDTLVRHLTAAAEWGVDIARADLERRVLGVKDAREMLLGIAWDLANDDAAAWALGYTDSILRRFIIPNTTAPIGRLVQNWITNGEPLYVLRDNIAAAGQFSRTRAQAIAVTEVTRAYAEGNMAAWKRSGVIARHQWQTAVDEMVCFPAGTLVSTDGGDVPIEKLKVADLVLTRQGYRRVTSTIKRSHSGGMTRIIADGREIIATADHLVWESEQGWLSARDFSPGHFVDTVDNKRVQVNGVFNFYVGDSDNVPPATVEERIAPRVSGNGLGVPVRAVNLNGDAVRGQREVNAVSADFGLLDVINPRDGQNAADFSFGGSLPGEPAIAGHAAKSPRADAAGRHAKLFTAIFARDQHGRPAAFFRAIMPFVAFLAALKQLAAPFALYVLNAGVSALNAANRVSVSLANKYRELFIANRAELGDTGGGGKFARFAAKPFAALDAIGGRIERLAAMRARAVFARALALRGVPFKFVGRQRHSAQLRIRLHVLYHGLFANAIDVYDIQVEGAPEFYANGILVHNCPYCGPVHGKVVAIGESFGMVGTSPPAHPRCRCWLVPVTEYSEVDAVGLEQFGL